MSTVDEALELIRKVCNEVGLTEFSKLSGVPYTTLAEAKRRGFVGPSIETFQKLAAAAETHVSEQGSQDAAA